MFLPISILGSGVLKHADFDFHPYLGWLRASNHKDEDGDPLPFERLYDPKGRLLDMTDIMIEHLEEPR